MNFLPYIASLGIETNDDDSVRGWVNMQNVQHTTNADSYSFEILNVLYEPCLSCTPELKINREIFTRLKVSSGSKQIAVCFAVTLVPSGI